MIEKISQICFIFEDTVFDIENKEDALIEIYIIFKTGTELVLSDEELLKSKEISTLVKDLIVGNNLLELIDIDKSEKGPISIELEFSDDIEGLELIIEEINDDNELDDDFDEDDEDDEDDDERGEFGFSGDWWKKN